MPRFHYKAVTTEGEFIEGDMDAVSQDKVISELQIKGHLPISADEITEQKSFKTTRQFPVYNQNRISKKDITLFTRELATLLEAGLPLDQALSILIKLSSTEAIRTMVSDILNKVQEGTTLSTALSAYSKYFTQLYISTIQAGEASGSQSFVLKRLADYLEQSDATRSNIISVMLYPAILFTVSILSLIALMIFVVPQFIPLFEDLGEALPLSTHIIIITSLWLQEYGWILFGLFAVMLWFMDKQFKNPAIKKRWDQRCLGVPLIGNLILQIETSRFALTLHTLLSNGVPLITSITLVKEVITNFVLAQEMDEIKKNLEQGGTISNTLKESGNFPDLAMHLIEIGENTGQLESMLEKISDIYDKEVQHTIKRLLTIIEPVVIIGLGLLIAFIIITLLTTILSLNELVI